jgi:DNA-directed RNA polymerase subunit RPC12/RpoP
MEPIGYEYQCIRCVRVTPSQLWAEECCGEEAEEVYVCGKCERAHGRQRQAEDCCEPPEMPPDTIERAVQAAAINRGTW